MASLIKQVEDNLLSKMRAGDSRYQAKIMEGTHAPGGIFSYGTLETYLKHSCTFAKWVRAEHRCNTLEKARPYVEEYLQSGIDRGLQIPSVHTGRRSANCIIVLQRILILPCRRGSVPILQGAVSPYRGTMVSHWKTTRM